MSGCGPIPPWPQARLAYGAGAAVCTVAVCCMHIRARPGCALHAPLAAMRTVELGAYGSAAARACSSSLVLLSRACSSSHALPSALSRACFSSLALPSAYDCFTCQGGHDKLPQPQRPSTSLPACMPASVLLQVTHSMDSVLRSAPQVGSLGLSAAASPTACPPPHRDPALRPASASGQLSKLLGGRKYAQQQQQGSASSGQQPVSLHPALVQAGWVSSRSSSRSHIKEAPLASASAGLLRARDCAITRGGDGVDMACASAVQGSGGSLGDLRLLVRQGVTAGAGTPGQGLCAGRRSRSVCNIQEHEVESAASQPQPRDAPCQGTMAPAVHQGSTSPFDTGAKEGASPRGVRFNADAARAGGAQGMLPNTWSEQQVRVGICDAFSWQVARFCTGAIVAAYSSVLAWAGQVRHVRGCAQALQCPRANLSPGGLCRRPWSRGV